MIRNQITVDYQWIPNGKNVIFAYNTLKNAEIYKMETPYRLNINGDIQEKDVNELLEVINNSGYYLLDRSTPDNHGTVKIILNKEYSKNFFEELTKAEKRIIIEFNTMMKLDYISSLEIQTYPITIRLDVDNIDEELITYLKTAEEKNVIVTITLPEEKNESLSDIVVNNNIQHFVTNLQKKYYIEDIEQYHIRMRDDNGIAGQIIDKSYEDMYFVDFLNGYIDPYWRKSRKIYDW